MWTPDITAYTVHTHPEARGAEEGLRHAFASVADHMDMLGLSVAESRKWSEVRLYADAWSAERVAEWFPADDITLLPDWLDEMPRALWSLPKLATQQMVAREAHGGWMHLDSDAIFLRPPSFEGEVILQFAEPTDGYRRMEEYMWGEAGLLGPYSVGPSARIYNTGLLACRTPRLAEQTNDRILAWCRTHAARLHRHPKLDPWKIALLVEQGWQSLGMADVAVPLLAGDTWAEIRASAAAPGFVHLLGASKRHAPAMEKVRKRLAAA
ncbi:MAG: hypothetical protein KA004_17400 [Verrucomicrobiales bacterium]|nr:hypothetical protein [Verrucomicrobiales bacterium]